MIGAHLKEVRKSLHFSQEQMTEGILDRSFYSRVENDCSEINVNDLVKLLHYHRIPVADFLRGFGTTSTDIEILQNRITTAYLNEDVVTLQDLYINTKFADVRMKKVVRILINRLNGVNNLDERDREFSYSFLNEDNWNSENLWLVLHMLDLYELSDLKILVETIFHKVIRKKTNERSMQLAAQIALKYLEICCKRQTKNSEIKNAIAFLQKLPKTTNFAIHRIAAEYYNGLVNHDQEGADKIANLLVRN